MVSDSLTDARLGSESLLCERAMLIVCPSCTTSYEIGTAALGANGRSVRCAHCKNTWFAAPAEVPATADAEWTLPDPAAAPLPPSAPAEPSQPVGGDVVVQAEAPSIVPHHLPPAAQLDVIEAEAPPPPEAIETVAARRAARRQAERKNRPSLIRRLATAPMAIFILLVTLACLLQWRDKVVRYAPQMGSLFASIGMPVNLRGLVFEGVTSSTEMSDGVPVLIIEGTIVNVTRKTLEVPRLRFSLRNSAHQEVYAWTSQPPKPTVGSGNGLAFRTRLASPPPDGRDVIVRFFSRHDVTAGMQ
jgi:predicted Zn finger-like uncharacterized protein